jgi:hypothetical protein
MRLTKRTRKLLTYVLIFLVVILVGVALVESLLALEIASIRTDQNAEGIISQYRALEPFVAEQDEVGFIYNLTGSENSKYLYLLQYTLAPTVVVRNENCCALLVAYSDDAGPPLEFPEGFQVVRDFGDGLYLLERD